MNSKQRKLLKRVLAMLADIALLYLCLYIAALLRGNLGMDWTRQAANRLWYTSPLFVALYVIALNLAGVYRVSWKYADLRDMLRLLLACLVCALLSLAINAIFNLRYSRLVLVFFGAMSFVVLTASRFALLLIQNLMFADKNEKHVRRALIIGADEQGTALIKALSSIDDGARHEAVAFLDDDVDKLYRRISGLTVEGTSADISKVIKSKHADEVLFTSPLKRDEDGMNVYLSAVAEGLSVSKYVSGTLRRIEPEEMLDGGRWDTRELKMTYRHNIAIIGTSELARQIAVLASENGAGKVFVLDNDAQRLSGMAREGAWCKLGSPTGENGMRDFLRKAKPAYVFYMAGIGDQDIISGNEQAIVRQNVLAPINALRHAHEAGASSFVYVSDTRDENGSARMFACGEDAVLNRQSEEMSVSAVSIDGLLDRGGPLNRMITRAQTGQKLSVIEGERKSFISCRSAAAALLGIAKSSCRGRFTVRGALGVDMELLARAVLALTSSRTEVEIKPKPNQKPKPDNLSESGLDYTFRRKAAASRLPECLLTTPPSLPDGDECAKMLGG